MSKIELPDYLKDISDDTAKDLVSISGGAPRISIRGRQFRFKKDGEEILTQTEPIHVIILGVVPKALMAKTFYIDGYQPGSTDPPDCSSFLGVNPDSWVGSPQAVTCRECDNNVWGSAKSMSGKKAKACKDSKRLMVISAKDAKEKEPDVYIFNVTIASLKALSEFGKFLISNKLPMAAVITEIAFVDSEFPQVEFTFKSVLNKTIGTKMLGMASEEPWMDGLDNPQIAAPVVKPQLTQSAGTTSREEPPIPDENLLDNW